VILVGEKLSGREVATPPVELTQLDQSGEIILRIAGPRTPTAELHRVRPPGVWLGRAASCDIRLEDPDRFVSTRHARIDYSNGVFWLSDHSTNGTYLNGSSTPMGREETQPLRRGDRFRVGLFDIRVVTDGDVPNDSSLYDDLPAIVPSMGDPFASVINPLNTMTPPWPSTSIARPTLPRFGEGPGSSQPDELATLIADLLTPGTARPTEPDPPIPVASVAAGREADYPTDVVQTTSTRPVEDISLDIPLASNAAPPGPHAAGLHAPAPHVPAPQMPPLHLDDGAARRAPSRPEDAATAALAAFWRGLGVLPTQMDPAELYGVMAELGLALRETSEGFGILLRAIATSGPAADNPLSDGHMGLRRHLQTPTEDRKPLEAAVREVFTILAEREDAYVKAVHAGVRRAVQSVSAKAIEERFGPSLRSTFATRRRAELWELLRSMEDELTDLAEMQFRKEVSGRMSSRVQRVLTFEDSGNGL
jgi:type VI secretion system FHA domain protein